MSELLQSDEIIRTELTRRCWRLPIDPLPEVLPPAVLPPAVPEVPEVVPPDVLPPDVLPPDVLPPDMAESVVPVTSTLWPTCFFRSASCPSSTYDDPIEPDAVEPDDPEPLVPDVEPPAVDPEPLAPDFDPLAIVAFVRMYEPPLFIAPPLVPDEVDPVDPDVPAVPLLSCTHPITVTVFPLLFFSLCVLPLCAAAPTTQLVAIAIAVAVHV